MWLFGLTIVLRTSIAGQGWCLLLRRKLLNGDSDFAQWFFCRMQLKFQQLHLSSLHFQTLQISFHPQAECVLQECWISHDQDLVAILCLLDVKESELLDYSENEETLSDRIWISSSIIYCLHIHLAGRKTCRATWCGYNRVAESSFITIQSSSEKGKRSQNPSTVIYICLVNAQE